MKRLRIQEHFASLEDPRVERRKLHELMDVVIVALLAVRRNELEGMASVSSAKSDLPAPARSFDEERAAR